MKQEKIPNLSQIIKWLILVVVLVLLVNYIVQHSHEFGFLRTIQTEYIVPVILLSLFGQLLSYCRFYVLLVQVAHRIPPYTVFKYFIFGRFINKFFPYGGSVYRAIMFKKSDGVSYKKYIASNVSFDWINLIYATLFGVLVIAVYDPQLKIRSIPLRPLFVVVFVLLIVAFPMAKIVLTRINRHVSPGPFQNRMRELAEIVDRVLNALKNRSVLLSNSIIIALLIFSSLISYHLLFKSIGVGAHLVVLLVYLIIIRFFRAMRITPANLGIREFLLGYLSYSLGTGAAEGVAVSIMMRLITLSVQGGLILVLFASEGVYWLFGRLGRPK
jgi:uncharacterized protein (TIRG00374 family)